MRIATNLHTTKVKTLSNIQFGTFVVIVESYQDILKDTIVLVLPNEVVFFMKDAFNSQKIIFSNWNDTIRNIRCRPIKNDESLTIVFDN